MKSQYRIVVTAATAAAALALTSARAEYKPVGDDGIAASPKVRQFLNEHPRVAAVSQVAATHTVAASASYRAVGDEHIAASPKFREQLNPRSPQHSPLAAAK